MTLYDICDSLLHSRAISSIPIKLLATVGTTIKKGSRILEFIVKTCPQRIPNS